MKDRIKLHISRRHTHTSDRPVLLYGTTVGSSARHFLKGQLNYFDSVGWDVHLATTPDDDYHAVLKLEQVTGHPIHMQREISPANDLRSLISWIRLMIELRPSVVNVGTPKAGLLGLLSARICHVPQRIYTVRGLRYETHRGWKRSLLVALEKVAIKCSTDILAVSASLRSKMLEDGLTSRPIFVIGDGSSNGVQSMDYTDLEIRTRNHLNISSDAFVVGYVGRMSPDKGTDDLISALHLIAPSTPNIVLLLVGGEYLGEPSTHLPFDVISTGWVEEPRKYYSMMDVLCLPTLREGFPNVVLEAAIAGIPSVTTTATGAVDSVTHLETGMLVPPNSPSELANSLSTLSKDSGLRHELGSAAHRRATTQFAPDRIWRGLDALYTHQSNPDVGDQHS